jgi:hypothetical protein
MLASSDESKIRMFRNIVSELHDLVEFEVGPDGFRMVGGYVESEAVLARLQAISIPVRRSYMPTDPINFEKMCDILKSCDSEEVSSMASVVEGRYNAIRDEVESKSILDETPIRHGDMLEAWLDAALYKDFGDRARRFNELVTRFGKTVEGIAWHLTERLAELILELDEVARRALGDDFPESSGE